MQLREMIEVAAKKCGNQNDLAKVIDISAKALTEAKAGRRGLPAIACGKLAEILEIDRWTVIAASELVTERNEDKRAYFSPFVLNGVSSLATVLTAVMLTTAPGEASASNDTFNVSRPALQPAPLTDSMAGTIHIMLNKIKKAHKKPC